jgi:hypothetical protein
MELFEKVDFVAHFNYQDSNRGPLNFVKNIGGVVGAQQFYASVFPSGLLMRVDSFRGFCWKPIHRSKPGSTPRK